MAVGDIGSYYALMGQKGPSQEDLMCEFTSLPNFPSNQSDELTVRMTNFFVVDKDGNLASFERDHDLEPGVFLHGDVLAWDGTGDARRIGGMRVRKW